MLHSDSTQGSATIANERHDVLHNNSDEGNMRVTPGFEEVEEIEMNNNSAKMVETVMICSKIICHENCSILKKQWLLHLETKVEWRRKQRSLIAKKEQGKKFAGKI